MRNIWFSWLIVITSCTADNDTIRVKGSDTEVNLAVELAESFHSTDPSVLISISGGGSGLGIASLLNGTADIANSSRSIKAEELRLFEKRNVAIDSFVFAQDAIAVVVSNDLKVDSMLTSVLGEILSGKHKNWSSITGQDRPINIYGRQSNSGTYDFVKQKLGIEFTPYAKQMNGNAQILEAIKADNSGIGYVGAGYVNRKIKGIKIIRIHSIKSETPISPLDAQMIAQGKYFFQRPLFQYYKSSSYTKIKPFLDFEKSDNGVKIVTTSGYYPVNKISE